MAQADGVVANGTGAAVRSDLNGQLAALFTNHSGSTEPSTTYSHQFWADTNANVLKIRNSANNAWITLRELDGTMLIEDGTAAAPGLSFASDTNSGLFGGSDTIGFATGGAERLEIGSSEVVFNDPSNDVDFRVESNGNANMLFVDAGNDRVGIGTGSPSNVLSLDDTEAAGGVGIDITNQGDGGSSTTPYVFINAKLNPTRPGGEIRFGREGVYGSESTADSFMAFYTAEDSTNAERVRIDSSGRLLVGTSTFDSTRPSGAIHLDNVSTTPGFGNISLGFNGTNADNHNVLNFYRTRGTSSGAVTIVQSGDHLGSIAFSGADGTDAKSQAAQIYAQVDGTPASNDMPGRLILATTADGAASPTERVRINSSGNVGIGETAPLGKLHVKTADSGSSSVGASADEFVLENSGNTGMTILSGTTNQGLINFGDSDDVNPGNITYDHNSNFMSFKTNDVERVQINNGGTFMVGPSIISDNINGQGLLFTDGGFIRLGNLTGSGSASMAQFKTGSGNTEVLRFRCDGDLENLNNRYGAISDVNLKENIVDAGSQWDDIKNIRVRKYNFRGDLGYDTHTQIGVIAQELEQTCPGLVGDSYDLAEDGSNLETSRKSVSYSVLYMKAVKALQEAMDRIETLEAKVAALEAG